MSDVADLALAHIWIVLSGTALALVVAFAIWSKYTQSLWGKDFWVAIPFFGHMSRWSKMDQGTGDAIPGGDPGRSLVVPAEEALFHYYKDSLGDRSIGPTTFARAREFLKLAHQTGRKPMSLFLWLVLAGLTIAEAVGTGLLVAPLMSKDITPTLAMVVGTIVALAIAAIALMITHGAGEDMFRNSLMTMVKTSFRQNGGFRNRDGSKPGDTVNPVGPGDNQVDDEDLDATARLAARIGGTSMPAMEPKRLRIILSIVFIVVFGVATTAYRHYEFAAEQDAAASGASADAPQTNFNNMFGTSGSAKGLSVPDDVAQAAHKSQQDQKHATQSDVNNANDAGIMILAIIYVFTQLIGILTGFKYSFVGDAEKAYEDTLGEVSYEGFLRKVVRPVAERAELRMGQLRSKLCVNNPGYRDNQRRFSFMELYQSEIKEHVAVHEERTPPRAVSAPVVQPVAQAPAQAAVPGPSPARVIDLDGLAVEILDKDKSERQAAVTAIVRQYGMTDEQQRALSEALQREKDRRKPPALNPILANVLED